LTEEQRALLLKSGGILESHD